MKHSFGSDNHSGVHPQIMEALVNENKNFAVAYGEDPYTQKVLEKIQNLLGGKCKAFFVLNGTGANITGLSCFLRSFNSVIAPATAHIHVDECGAPERLTGSKVIPVPTPDGKITPEMVKPALTGFGFQHHSQPQVLSISQPTELGTTYTPDEIQALANLMHSHNCYLHMDGSRISNAAAYLNLPIKAFTADCGVDVLSFGGTKNGLLMGEAVVLFHLKEKQDKMFPYIRKQLTQLYSKSRFIAAQFDAYLQNDLYLQLAGNANAMARYLAKELEGIPHVKITRKIESNTVFAIIPPELSAKLLQKHYFYIWDESTNEVRWMCSFNTTQQDIDLFVQDIKNL